jgi:hypothetical protein
MHDSSKVCNTNASRPAHEQRQQPTVRRPCLKRSASLPWLTRSSIPALTHHHHSGDRAINRFQFANLHRVAQIRKQPYLSVLTLVIVYIHVCPQQVSDWFCKAVLVVPSFAPLVTMLAALSRICKVAHHPGIDHSYRDASISRSRKLGSEEIALLTTGYQYDANIHELNSFFNL